MRISLPIQQAAKLLDDAVCSGSITGERIDYYTVTAPGVGVCVVLVYEKHYWRAGNRLTLTVTMDNFTGYTQVHSVSGGGGEGLLRFDWGAASSFASIVEDTLGQYQV